MYCLFCCCIFCLFCPFAFLPFCLFFSFSFSFCLFVFLPFFAFCLFTFLPFSFLYFCHNRGVHIYYHTNFCSNLKNLNFTTNVTTHFTTNVTTNHYHYHQPPPPLHTHTQRCLYLREINTSKCFEKHTKILRGCKNLVTIEQEEEEKY